METTGGLSEMAVGFCKEIKKRYESSNCWSDFECTRNYEINSLQSALNVELQRANSRMILERTPKLEDLIEGAIVKCRLAIAKKKEAAIEELKLGSLRPNRFHKNIKKGNCKDLEDPSIRESSITGSPVEEVKKDNSRILKKKKKKKKVNLSDGKWIRSKGGTIQSYTEESSNSLPLKPKPPEKCLSELRSVSMEWENEERILAPKTGTSQNPSTSEVPGAFLGASSSQDSTEMEEEEKVPWEPPSIRAKNLE